MSWKIIKEDIETMVLLKLEQKIVFLIPRTLTNTKIGAITSFCIYVNTNFL